MKSISKDRQLFALGIAICFAVAGFSVLLEEMIPGGMLGASIIALFTGTIINSFFHKGYPQAEIGCGMHFGLHKLFRQSVGTFEFFRQR